MVALFRCHAPSPQPSVEGLLTIAALLVGIEESHVSHGEFFSSFWLDDCQVFSKIILPLWRYYSSAGRFAVSL